jgi:hypothetical protein
MLQLAAGGERLPTAQTELSLERRASGTVRRDDRLAAARSRASPSVRDSATTDERDSEPST